MPVRQLLHIPAAFAAALTAVACGDDGSRSLRRNPTPPVAVTETFEDSLNPNGGRTHQFNADRAGNVIASLTSLAPDPDGRRRPGHRHLERRQLPASSSPTTTPS